LQVAVKQIDDKHMVEERDYEEEADIHDRLTQLGSDHIVEFLASDRADADAVQRMKEEYPYVDKDIADFYLLWSIAKWEI
jgi:hypothetical protein